MKNQTQTPAESAKTYRLRDFCGKRKIFVILSSVLILISILSSFIFGVEIAIEFKGGTIISYSYEGAVDTQQVDDIAQEVLGTPVVIQTGESYVEGGGNSMTISFSYEEGGFTAELQDRLTTRISEQFPDANVACLESNDVSPSSGQEFFLKCIVASLFAAILIILYIAWRFQRISGWSAGVSAVCALVHDLILVYGAFVLMGFEINANFMAVILTILGYSVNDTIVIYDRIRENQKLLPGNTPLNELINISLSQSFRRTMRTSITTISAMIVVSVVAGVNHLDSILSFSLPMIVGMASGTYSSLCIAPTIWAWWNEKQGKNTAAKTSKQQ